MDQRLSKDMKKQGHVKSRKPRNKKLSSEKSLAESPKKGRFTDPSSKKLDGEKFLTKSKLTHIKEYNEFGDDDSNIQEEDRPFGPGHELHGPTMAHHAANRRSHENPWKTKADKWDKLSQEIGEYYETEGKDGEEIAPKRKGDLCDIGEVAARAFGYM